MNCQTRTVDAPAFGTAWKFRPGRTEAPAPELSLGAEPFALAAEIQPTTPAKPAPITPDTTPDLFTL